MENLGLVKVGLKKIASQEFEGRKTFDASDMQVTKDDSGNIFIAGYVNTKGKADAYGDIPANYNGQPVYVMTRYANNSVLLMNHDNETKSVIGMAVEMREDDIGLYVKFKLMRNPQTDEAKHTIQAIIEGLLKAFSIGGRWYFEDEENPAHLTKAFLHEISVVAIGADVDALITTVSSKSAPKDEEPPTKADSMAELVKAYRQKKSEHILNKIQLIRKH